MRATGGGRKSKPTYLKLITNNPGKRRLNKAAEPKGEPLTPPPAELSPDALTEWQRISQLAIAGMLTAADRSAVAAYCQAYGRWMQAERLLTEMARRNPPTMGLLIRTSNGNWVQNPLVGTANKAMSDMVRFGAELGLTPTARSRLTDTPHGNDPTDKFFDT